jgi:hypothetical protein
MPEIMRIGQQIQSLEQLAIAQMHAISLLSARTLELEQLLTAQTQTISLRDTKILELEQKNPLTLKQRLIIREQYNQVEREQMKLAGRSNPLTSSR